MTTALTAPPVSAPRNLLWTVAEFHNPGDLGIFEGRRAKLLDGVIIEEGPMTPPHRLALELADDAVRATFGSGWRFCIQLPLVLSQTTDPQPDVAVIHGTSRRNPTHPTTAALVIEVADSSLRFDTTTKLAFYAASGIADYWVIDVNNPRLLVFREPHVDPVAGPTYRTQRVLAATDDIEPLAAPGRPIRVADLLP